MPEEENINPNPDNNGAADGDKGGDGGEVKPDPNEIKFSGCVC